MAGYPQPPEPDEREVRLRCNAAMGWTRWQADARRPVGPMPPFKTREEEIAWISDRLGGHREEPGSEVGVYRNKELLAMYYAICFQMVRAGLPIPSAAPQEVHQKAHPWRSVVESIISAIFLIGGSIPGLAMMWRWVLFAIAFVLIFFNVLEALPVVQRQSESTKRLCWLGSTVLSLAIAWPIAYWVTALEAQSTSAEVSAVQRTMAGRSLTTAQGATLRRYLAPLKGHNLYITADMTDSEANRFAYQLYSFLGAEVGIEDGEGINRAVFSGPIPPLTIVLRAHIPPQQSDPEVRDALVLRSGLVAAGLLSQDSKIELQSPPPSQSSSLGIIVGPSE